MLQARGGSYEKRTLAYTGTCFEPIFSDRHAITRTCVAGLVNGVREMKDEIFAKDGSFVQPPPSMVFMNRLQFGFYSVLACLDVDVEVEYARVERAFLGATGLLG